MRRVPASFKYKVRTCSLNPSGITYRPRSSSSGIDKGHLYGEMLQMYSDPTKFTRLLLHKSRGASTAFKNSTTNRESKNSSTCLTLSSPSPFGAISTTKLASLTKGMPTVVSALSVAWRGCQARKWNLEKNHHVRE